MSLTSKILLAFALVVTVALMTTSLLIGRSAGEAYRGYMSGYMRQRMPEYASQAASVYADTNSWATVQDSLDQSAAATVTHGRRGQGMTRQVDAAQLIVVDSKTGKPLATSRLAQVSDASLSTGEPVILDGKTIATIVTIGQQSGMGQAEQALLDEVNRAIAVSAIIAGVLSLLLGGLLIRSILQPLRRLETGVAQVAMGNLDARVEVLGKDELAALAGSFNEMATSLQRQERLRQNLMADIAHELRTPLSVIQGNLQAILDGVYPLELAEITSVYEETVLLSRLVLDLHELAQAEAGQLTLTIEQVDVDAVIQSMVGAFNARAREKDIHLNVQKSRKSIIAMADPDRLRQILYNLVGNAFRHTPAGGSIDLGAKSVSDSSVRIWVRNSGSTLSPQESGRVFDRLYRSDSGDESDTAQEVKYTANAGLGLTIVKALVEAHGGRVGVDSRLGDTATFWFEIPSSA